MATNVSEKDKTLHEVIDYLDDGWKIINVTAANPLALDNEAVVLYVIEKTTANHWSKRNE